MSVGEGGFFPKRQPTYIVLTPILITRLTIYTQVLVKHDLVIKIISQNSVVVWKRGLERQRNSTVAALHRLP